jgi:hypothetical protein
MRIHNLLIAGALAGLMATAGTTQAQGMTDPLHFASSGHKHVKKHHGSAKHLAITKDGGKTRTAGGTVSKELIGKSNRPAKHNGLSTRRFSKHHVKSSNARMNHKHSMKSSKRYQ